MNVMRWAIRIFTVAALTAALGGLPIVLDQCAESCDAHAAAAAPACHHAQTAGAHVGKAPAGCPHDHTVAIGAALRGPSVLPDTFSALTLVAAPDAVADTLVSRISPAHIPPDPVTPLHARSLPLRV